MASEDHQSATTTRVDTTPGPIRQNGLWLDDFAEGMNFASDSYEVTREEIIQFAERYDPQAFHLGDEQAHGTFFGELAASGWHTAAITMRLLAGSEFRIATGVVGTNISLTWPSATRPGDVLHLEITIDEITRSKSRPNRGVIVLSYRTLNQHGEVRQQTVGRLVAWDNPATA
jgi:acyl dehydratase